MWDLPGPGLEPVSPASAGRLLTTEPPGKPETRHFWWDQTHYGLSPTKNKETTVAERYWGECPSKYHIQLLLFEVSCLWCSQLVFAAPYCSWECFVVLFFKLKKCLFYIGVQLIYNVVLVLGIQQSDSVIHIYDHIYSFSDSFPLLVIIRYGI